MPTTHDDGILAEHVQALNGHDPRAVLALYLEECHWAEPPGSTVLEGKRLLGHYLTLLFRAFPDLTVVPIRAFDLGDVIAVEWRAEGTHRGAFLGVPGTGLRINIHGASFLDIAGGLVQRSHHYCDSGALLRQIGVLSRGDPL